MFLYKNLKPEFEENMSAELFRKAASTINETKTLEELLMLSEEL